MAKLCGGDLFVRALKREGVKYIFSLCGGHINPIYNACIDEGIEIIDVRHEQVAAHAAAGWARATGEPGVAVVTAGPGVTDTVTGVAEAFMAGCPMIEFGGRAPLADFERGALQDLDQVRLMESITKWARTIYEVKRIPEYVSLAFRWAKNGTPGPVFLDCPVDILLLEVDENEVVFPKSYYPEAEVGGSPSQIRAAVELLMGAERPAIVGGDGLFWAKADKELREFVELTEIPVHIPSVFAQGAVPADHPLALGQAAAAMADVVLTLGLKLDFIQGFGRPPMYNADAKFIQVNLDATMIGYNRDADIGIVASPKIVLRQMNDEIKASKKKINRSAWTNQVSSISKMLEEQNAEACRADTMPIHPGRLAKDVVEFLISRGANVNPINECRKPLHFAVMGGHTSVVKLLIEKGADVNAEDCYSDVPLVYARTREIGEILLDNGANPNARDMSSFTTLHYAAGTGYFPNGSVDMVDLLISKGADVNLINGWGGTALSIAERKSHTEIAKLLRKHGAKE